MIKHHLKLFEKSINNKFKILPLWIKKNDVGEPKYIPPFFKEWKNTAYFYNKNTIKKLPFFNILINKLIRVYFNLFYKNLKKKKISVKRRNRLLKNMYVSKAELKYTNSLVIITIYTMNNLNSIFKKYEEYIDYLVRKKEWIEVWKRSFVPGGFHWNNKTNSFVKSKQKWIKRKVWIKQWPVSIMKQYIRPNFLNRIGFKHFYDLKKNINLNLYLSNNLKFDNLNEIFKLHFNFYNKRLELFYLEMIKLRLQEIREEYFLYLETIWKYNQKNLNNFIKLDNNNIFMLKLKNILSRILNKKIQLNIVNIKFHSYNPEFFTKSLSLKLKRKKFNIIKSMINVINRSKMDMTKINKYKLPKIKMDSKYKELSLISKINNRNLINLFKEFYKTKTIINYDYKKISDIIFKNIKYKNIDGIRLEIKGRLTKRYRADRSIYKLLWKGGLKNKESSFNNLSSTMFRGNLKPNTMYSISKNKRRIGAFAVKGWISGR